MCLARGQFVHHNERTIAMSFPSRTSLALALPFFLCLPPLLSLASCSASGKCATNDDNCDQVPDDIGAPMFGSAGQWLEADTDLDGHGDGPAIDENADGTADGVAIDVNGDGYYDGIDRDGDGVADRLTGEMPAGSGGAPSTGGTTGSGGVVAASGGTPGSGGTTVNTSGSCLTASPVHSPSSTFTGTASQYAQADTWRQNCSDVSTCPAVQYKFIANGWGPNWQDHTLTSGGTKLSVDSYSGTQGSGYEPAGYPTVFCGLYSDIQSGSCGLPATIASLTEIDTGLRWSPGTQGSDYNVAYDIWMGNGNSFAGFLMVWYRDPPANQPAGSIRANNVFVGGDTQRWDVWTGSVNGSPIVNYVRPNGEESSEFAFDALDFVEHAKANYSLPGDTVLSVAIGFEIWNGPVAGLKVEDFCVEVHGR